MHYVLGRAKRAVQLVNQSILKPDRLPSYAQACLYCRIRNVDPAGELGRAGQPHRRSRCQSFQIRCGAGDLETRWGAAKILDCCGQLDSTTKMKLVYVLNDVCRSQDSPALFC